ncbi:MAG: proton extrusion protein PcxA [Microcoleaceae cyanobacterium]
MDNPWKSTQAWLQKTPTKVLEQAYQSAVTIKNIEDEHFNGNIISATTGQYGDSVQAFFDQECRKHLNLIKIKLGIFRASSSFVNFTNNGQIRTINHDNGHGHRLHTLPEVAQEQAILAKLEFIDQVIGKYQKRPELLTTEEPVPPQPLSKLDSAYILEESGADRFINKFNSLTNNTFTDKKTDTNVTNSAATTPPTAKVRAETGILPRTLLGTINRIKKELDPDAEKEVINNFRQSKVRTIISIRFILLLILVPLLVHQLSKNFLVGPLVDQYLRPANQVTEVFINPDMENEALEEMERFERKLNFDIYTGKIPALSIEEREAKLKEKAEEISKTYLGEGSNAVKNIFADVIAIFSFVFILSSNRQDVKILKTFTDGVLYNLSDSAKAFILILSTDIFVGFHSPHGWEVILENLSRHLGLPESRDFNFLFIATFPVILDAVFKYWIFRYLNRSSPSAVATYKNMNE